MWSEFWTSTKMRVREKVIGFARDTGNVFQALGAWGIIFLLVQIVLGLLPIIGVLTLGATVDAMIGARGIGVVTSDVNDSLSWWLAMLIAGFLAYLFSVRFTGKAGEVGRGLREIITFASLLMYLITINQIFLALLSLTLLLVDVIFSHDTRIRLAGLLLALLAASSVAYTLIRYTVLRSFTVGEGLTMVAAIALIVIFLKLRIAYAPHH